MSAGFSIHHGVFTSAEIPAFAASLESQTLERTRAGARHLLGVPSVRSMAEDPRMLAIARDILAGDAPGWGPWSEKQGILYAHAPSVVLEKIVALRVHLDDSTEENGPLRVIAESHHEGVLSDMQVSERAARAAPVACLAPCGSIVAMRPLIIHASSKGSGPRPRRVLHIEYAESLDLCGGIRLRAA